MFALEQLLLINDSPSVTAFSQSEQFQARKRNALTLHHSQTHRTLSGRGCLQGNVFVFLSCSLVPSRNFLLRLFWLRRPPIKPDNQNVGQKYIVMWNICSLKAQPSICNILCLDADKMLNKDDLNEWLQNKSIVHTAKQLKTANTKLIKTQIHI